MDDIWEGPEIDTDLYKEEMEKENDCPYCNHGCDYCM